MRGERRRARQPDEIVIRHLDEIDLAAGGEFSAPRRHQHQAIFAEAESFEMFRKCVLGRKAEIGRAAGDRTDQNAWLSVALFAFGMAEGLFSELQIVPAAPIGQCAGMTVSLLIFIAAVFLLAGFVKGVIGLGLPTVAMGLLAVAMAPAHALAIVIVPAILTNIWQTFVGPYFLGIVRRLWPLLLGLAVGVRLNGDMMTGPYARYGTVLIGVLLVIYAVISLRKFVLTIKPQDEKWIGGAIGLVTGVISAATGVQVIPSMPFLQALGMKKDELIQALGVFFTIATVVQAFNLSVAGVLDESVALPGVVALACSFAGMAIGQAVRTRLEPETFRHWFLVSMILLGIYLAGVATYEIHFA